jgi:serine/threonine-protein kinase
LKPADNARSPHAAEVRAQLRRILVSPEFASSQRMQRFLQLAVSETLAGHGGDLKEYRVGVEVFDRPASFDPSADPIVRVEARRLRDKLAKYYETAGRHDALLIELPKGCYVPVFRSRQIDARETAPAGSPRIAVLPFVNLTGSPEGADLADGLVWELIHGLTRMKQITVVAWNSAVQFRDDRQPDMSIVKQKLNVTSALAGSVRRSGGTMRVVAQLIDATMGVYLWSETYERRLEQAADIPREISDAIITTLQLRLNEARLGQSRSYNPDAYALYLRGRGEWGRRTESALRTSLESFRSAAELDPNLAAAYAGMADACTLLAEYGIEPPTEIVPHAKASALRALEIDPSLGEAHCSLGLVLAMNDWDWSAAETHFRRALELNPGYATTHHWFACDFLPIFGRLEEAWREVEIAVALDPLSGIIAEGKSFLYVLERRYEEAETQLRSIIASDPGFFKAYTSLGRVYIQMGRYADALAMLEKGRQMAGDLPTILGATGQAYGLDGQVDRASEILAQLERMRESRYAPATCLALTHLGMGDRDRALRWIETGLDRRESSVVLLNTHPVYDGLRDHSEFERLVARLRLRPQS